MRKLEKDYTIWIDSGRKGREPTQRDYTRQSELIKQNALKLYEKVLNEYPRYRRNDEVLFYLGYNNYEAGDKKKAVSHYWTLIKQFPSSRLVPDSYLQLGEHFFNSNNVGKARKALERALATKSPKIYNYALYKLAWCDYNVQEYAAGIKKLKEVISRSERLRGNKGVQLKGEALGDLARFFSFVDEVDTAFAYFKKKGGEEIALRYTTKLGELFNGQGKWDLEIQTYQMLNQKYPMAAKAPALQARIVSAYSKLNKKELVRQEVERLVDLYRPNTPWYKAQERKKDTLALEYAYDLTESHLRDLVTEYHRDAQKRKNIETYELARDIYRKYLEAFRDSESAYQMNFFYGEVLWALKEWKNAALEYDRVARWEAKEGKRGRFARTAAYNAILAWEKIAAEGEKGTLKANVKIRESKKKGKVTRNTRIKIKKLEQDKTYDEEPIPEVELKLSAACDLYFNIADPKDKDLPAIKFKAAFIYYKHNHFVEAAKRYFEMIERWPGSDLSRKSANLILDSLNVKKNWDELEKYARAFRGNKKLVGRDKKFKEQVQTLVEGAAFKSILKADGDAKKMADAIAQKQGRADAATRFRGFHTEFPKSVFAETALFNALLIYDKADELDNAIEAAELLLRSDSVDSDKSKKKKNKKRAKKRRKKGKKKIAKANGNKPNLKARTAFLLAGFYERIANFTKAAKLYESFYGKYEKEKRAADALFNAGVYYQGIGRWEKAVELFKMYVSEFKSAKDASEVYWRVCEIYDAEKDAKKASVCWAKFRDKYKKAPKAKVFESRYRLALNYETLKQRPKALKEYKWILKTYPKLVKKAQEADGARLAGAHAAFVMLEPEFKAFKKMKVTLKKKVLERKVKAAGALAAPDAKSGKSGKYLTVLQYGNGDYGIAALTRMGMVFRNMANSIRNAPVPRRLSEDQKEIYRAELDNFALGPEEKALEAFERALGKAYELNIYNEWTLKAQDNLKELNPNKFPEPQKIGFRGAEGFYVADLDDGSATAAANDNEEEAEEEETEEEAEVSKGASS
ncbi:MAG: tetratricopeptide repeat protein [Myxococcota bacterium]|nr:tetratricopeptide repeat protein [Myxococcota bacterium]